MVSAARCGRTTALLTDHYELTMVHAALRSGAAGRRAVFEVFARRLPSGRRYGVVAGTGRLIEALDWFQFDDDTLAFLERANVVDEPTRRWLAGYRFTGDIWGYPEGECYFPGSLPPVHPAAVPGGYRPARPVRHRPCGRPVSGRPTPCHPAATTASSQAGLIGFRSRLTVVASWSWDYLRRDRPIRLIVRSGYDPVAATLMPDR